MQNDWLDDNKKLLSNNYKSRSRDLILIQLSSKEKFNNVEIKS